MNQKPVKKREKVSQNISTVISLTAVISLTGLFFFCLLVLSLHANAQQAVIQQSTSQPAPSSAPDLSAWPSWQQLIPPQGASSSQASSSSGQWSRVSSADALEGNRQTTGNRLSTDARIQSQAGRERSSIEYFFSSQAHEGLEQFGYSLFRTSAFSPPSTAPVSSNYIIGPGDEVCIYLWGLVENSFRLVVDQNGKIILPRLGVLYVSGLRLAELKKFLFRQFSRLYSKFNLDVSLGKLRSIQVIIAGEVCNPGTYQLSPLSTIYHALFCCAGPTRTGSLRTIRRIRQNQTIDQVDLYHFLLNGDRSQDKPLEDGDTIFVPPIGPVVAIVGPVKRPGIYEQKGPAEPLTVRQLMELAGGTFLGGVWGVPGIERIRSTDEKTPERLSFDAPIKDGDLIRLSLGMVTLSGEVRHPGRFIIQRGDRLSSVLKRAGGFTEFAYLRGAFFTRKSIQKVQQERLNRYILDLQRQFLLLSSRAAEESLSRQEDRQRIEKTLSIENQLLDKLKESQATGRVIIELDSLEKFQNSATDIELEDGDTLHIPPKPSTITVLGEVYNPTAMIYTPSRRAEYYLQKVGGLTADAEEENIYIIKVDGSIVGKNCTYQFINLHWNEEEKSFISGATSAICLEPGDTVIVPPKIKSLALKRNVLDWSQIFYQTALGAGVIISAY
ncbi:MAG: SLBB domain-containing protein [bacterium]